MPFGNFFLHFRHPNSEMRLSHIGWLKAAELRLFIAI